MTKTPGDRQDDLEARTDEFARRVRAFVKRLPHTIYITEDVKQTVRWFGLVWDIRVLHFEFVSYFEIRISNFT